MSRVSGVIPPGTESTLECPCCGDVGAEADAEGLFYDGLSLVCRCNGHVCVEENGDAWINAYECDCQDKDAAS